METRLKGLERANNRARIAVASASRHCHDRLWSATHRAGEPMIA
jgi:hypothetical protein